MKKLKMFVCIAMVMTMLWHSNSTVYAVTHKAGCENEMYLIICGNFVSNAGSGSHYVYDKHCKCTAICTRTLEIHLHAKVCSNSSCRAVYSMNMARPCIEKHSYCPAEMGLCQY